MKTVSFLLIATVAGLFLTGCATYPKLVPGPGAKIAEEKCSVEGEGVYVDVQAEAWFDQEYIKEQVTPVKVTIKNNHGSPIRIRFSDFALVGSSTKRYSALPPYEIKGTIETPELRPGYSPMSDPLFSYRRFFVAPYYSPIYPTLPTLSDPFYYDPYYYHHYYTHWKTVQLPTQEMLKRAFPEGDIKDGGFLSGFIYFERVGKEEKEVTFRMDLLGAEKGDRFCTLSVPFLVK